MFDLVPKTLATNTVAPTSTVLASGKRRETVGTSAVWTGQDMKRICLVMTVHYLEVLGSGVSVAVGERFVVKRGVAFRIGGVRDWPTASKSARFISRNRPHRHSRTQGSTQGAREIEKNESVD